MHHGKKLAAKKCQAKTRNHKTRVSLAGSLLDLGNVGEFGGVTVCSLNGNLSQSETRNEKPFIAKGIFKAAVFTK